jgi:hypothetical protein
MTNLATGQQMLTVAVRLEEEGPVAARESVSDADLEDVRSELWLAGCLRRGHPETRLHDLSIRLLPLLRSTPDHSCRGFALEAVNPDGETIRAEFSSYALSHVAERAARRLLADGRMRRGHRYHYEIIIDGRPPLAPAASDGFSITARHPPLTVLRTPLRPLQEKARTMGPEADWAYPVFFTAKALEHAERAARSGARNHPPTETGAVLVGPLCSCPETGELFTVVCEALEVRDAEETAFSLTYSGKSWARIQAVIRARQTQPATRADRLLGQCHGHNFPPAGGAPPCELCAKTKICTRTSVFVSTDDCTWSRAVFSRQPWQLCHIFGENARREPVASVFGLHDGGLLERGYQVIPEFRPDV